MEVKKRGRPSKKPNYWSIRDMLNYAAEKDSNVKSRLDSQVLLSNGSTEGEVYRHKMYSRIKRGLKDYKIGGKLDESKKTSPYVLGEPFAIHFVDNFLKTDFERIKIDETWTKQEEESRDNFVKQLYLAYPYFKTLISKLEFYDMTNIHNQRFSERTYEAYKL